MHYRNQWYLFQKLEIKINVQLKNKKKKEINLTTGFSFTFQFNYSSYVLTFSKILSSSSRFHPMEIRGETATRRSRQSLFSAMGRALDATKVK